MFLTNGFREEKAVFSYRQIKTNDYSSVIKDKIRLWGRYRLCLQRIKQINMIIDRIDHVMNLLRNDITPEDLFA